MSTQRATRLRRTGAVLWTGGAFAVGVGVRLSDPWILVVMGLALLSVLVFQGLLFFALGDSETRRKDLLMVMEYVTEVTGTSSEELRAQAQLKRVQAVKAEPHLIRSVQE